MRVDLMYAKPPIWRRLDLPGNLMLDELHVVLHVAMGWQDGHLHEFGVGANPRTRATSSPGLISAKAEFLFNALRGVKPSRPGMRRDAFKAARSKTWGLRYDPKVTAAATAFTTAAVMRMVDSAVPRIIVRTVDQSLRTPDHPNGASD